VTDLCSAGSAARFCRLDVTDAEGWQQLADTINEELGGLDVLVNNAGINRRSQLTSMTEEEWSRLLEVNLTGPMLATRACAPLMRRRGGGAIVNIGSLAGLMGHPTTGYSAAKWGLRGLTKSAALEFAPWNIRVNAMHPGLVDTPIIDRESPAYRELQEMTPLQRAGTPDELARVVLFLACDDSSFITGVDIPVDGGLREFGTYGAMWRRARSVTEGRRSL